MPHSTILHTYYATSYIPNQWHSLIVNMWHSLIVNIWHDLIVNHGIVIVIKLFCMTSLIELFQFLYSIISFIKVLFLIADDGYNGPKCPKYNS